MYVAHGNNIINWLYFKPVLSMLMYGISFFMCEVCGAMIPIIKTCVLSIFSNLQKIVFILLRSYNLFMQLPSILKSQLSGVNYIIINKCVQVN